MATASARTIDSANTLRAIFGDREFTHNDFDKIDIPTSFKTLRRHGLIEKVGYIIIIHDTFTPEQLANKLDAYGWECDETGYPYYGCRWNATQGVFEQYGTADTYRMV